ncbi:MAG: hypothetical protein ABSF56_01285 [Minisyncoccia bacterium]|jgi:hypothetical protein
MARDNKRELEVEDEDLSVHGEKAKEDGLGPEEWNEGDDGSDEPVLDDEELNPFGDKWEE